MSDIKQSGGRWVRGWILVLVALVFMIVAVGGITRLTRSGLSIVEWNLVMGIFPPLTESHWMEEFGKYQQFPEYRKINFGMTLEDFKGIYFWEWFHRLLGRMIGLTAFFPLVYLQIRRKISGALAKKMWAAFVLVCLQGALGWFMVKSGLIEQPRVSHFRLAAHLSLAFFLAAYLLWIYQDLVFGSRRRADLGYAKPAIVLAALIYLQIIYGAFTAGLRAGFGYNSFPLMNGEFFPTGFFREGDGGWLVNLLFNPISVQFIHRSLGWAVLAGTAAAWIGWRRHLTGLARLLLDGLAAMVLLQFSLGVATLLLVVPVSLATAHQVLACGLFCVMISLLHALTTEKEKLNESAKSRVSHA